MKYNKPPLTYEDQAELLLRRGLISDKATLAARLQSVNYYRLSGYLYPFKRADDNFKNGTTIEIIWKNYCFDRQLRLLLIDAIERFEVALKTNITYNFAHQCHAFGYLEAENLPGLKPEQHKNLLEKIKEETQRSKEIFVKHFFRKYGDQHDFLPLWIASEVLSFGTTHTLYRGVSAQIKQQIAKKYGIADKVLSFWIGALQVIRNICAHHGRLYNRVLGVKPRIPRKDSQWHTPYSVDNSRVFSILSILNYILKVIAPQSHWKSRLFELLKQNKGIPHDVMGFYDGWQESPLWKE